MGGNIIIIKDENDFIFGGFASKQWKQHSQTTYGTGESFLYKFF